MTPQLSVVVPTYNRAAHLQDLLEQLWPIHQRTGIEVIVVDDGSRDDTPEVIGSRSWVVGLSQANGGAAAARNAGWRRCSAPVVAFIDDDCAPGPGWPELLLPAFDDPCVVGVGGTIEPTRGSALDAFVTVERLVDHGRPTDEGVDYLATANAAFKVSALEGVDGFDEGFPGAAGEDVDLSWRLRDAGGRLERAAAPVHHDHRATTRQILHTYRTHGNARAVIEARHPGRARGAAGRALSPRAWIARYQGYCAWGATRGRAAALVLLRVAGLGAFAWGLWRGRLRSRR